MSRFCEIRIRNVDASVLDKLDQLAKNKGVSRQAFLNRLLTNMAVANLISDREKAQDELLAKTVHALEENTKVMKEMIAVLTGEQE